MLTFCTSAIVEALIGGAKRFFIAGSDTVFGRRSEMGCVVVLINDS